MPDDAKAEVALEGIPETLLWTLWQRARGAAQRRPVLDDPMAVELVRTLDYPFAERFGSGFGQWQAVRALRFDLEIRRFLDARPDGQVVALGEGLETQFWRVDNGRVRWLGVDVPETVELRRRLLPAEDERRRTVACSALAEEWTELVDPDAPLLLSAQGLLMYFQPDEVHALIRRLAERFPGAELVFDGVPPWFSERTVAGRMKNPQGWQSPPMPWAVDAAERTRLLAIPGVAAIRVLPPVRGRGLLYGAVFPALSSIRPVRELGITGLPIMKLRFGAR
jgi:O-methyltransferase involved in polyketide biosynthesis